jgi:hypothetical protein
MLLGLTVVFEVAAVLLGWNLTSRFNTIMYAVSAVFMAGAGALVAARHQRNPVGWLFCGSAAFTAVTDAALGWGLRAAAEGWPYGAVGEWLAVTGWLPGALGWMLTFLLFPDGHLPSRRWRPVLWLGAVGFVLAMPGWSLSPDRTREFASGRNPLAVPALPTGALLTVGTTLFLGALVASAASLVIRFRRSTGDERQQLKWFAAAAAYAGVAMPSTVVLWYVTPAAQLLIISAVTALTLAACMAILRYRL